MQHKNIIFIAFVICLLFLAGCAKTAEIKNTSDFCEKLNETKCLDNQDRCALCSTGFSSYAGCHTREFCHPLPECDNVSDSNDKNTCLFNLAIETNDDYFCYKMTNVSFKNPCYQQIAMTNADAVLCAKVENKPYMERDVCYGNIAIQEKNLSMCNDIESSDYKTLCIAAIKQDTSMCSTIQNANMKALCQDVDNSTKMVVRSSPII